MQKSKTAILAGVTPLLLSIAWFLVSPLASDSQETKAPPPLGVHDVVQNLEARNRERSQALHGFEGTRVYSLHYRGFPHSYDAEMVVGVRYQAPATKEFTVISQSGSKFVIDRVFKKMLESEKQAGEDQSRTALSQQNYDFAMASYEATPNGARYELAVTPKSKNRFLYRGKIWVDATDFALMRIEAEPAQNPSFWIKKTEIHHTYKKDRRFLVARRESFAQLHAHRRSGRLVYRIQGLQDHRRRSDPGIAKHRWRSGRSLTGDFAFLVTRM